MPRASIVVMVCARICSQLITIAPGEGVTHTATFVGPIHGLGDTNMGWADVAAYLHQKMPHVKFVL